jgi:hypothetical protein
MGSDLQQHSLLWLLVVAGGWWPSWSFCLRASDNDVTHFGVTIFVMMSHLEVSASQAEASASFSEASAFLSEDVTRE